MQLTHLYDSKFINKFPENIQKILDNYGLTDSFSINIASLATQLGIQINSKLNPNDPTDRMKIAEIIGNQLVQYVQDDPNWYRAVQAHKLAEQLLMPKKLIINHRLNEILNINETIEDEKPNSHTVNRLTRDLILPDKILKQLMSDFTKSHPDDQKSITDNFNQTQASDRAIIKFISHKTNMPINNNLQLKLYDERIIDSLYRDID